MCLLNTHISFHSLFELNTVFYSPEIFVSHLFHFLAEVSFIAQIEILVESFIPSDLYIFQVVHKEVVVYSLTTDKFVAWFNISQG